MVLLRLSSLWLKIAILIKWLLGIEELGRNDVEKIMNIHWKIAVYHRKLKQTTAFELCQYRNARAQRNHIFMST